MKSEGFIGWVFCIDKPTTLDLCTVATKLHVPPSKIEKS